MLLRALALCLVLAQLAGAAVIRQPGCVVSTLAGSPFQTNPTGGQDGPAATATFFVPLGVAVNATGYVFVADHLNQALRVITPGPASTVTRVPSSAPGGLYGRGAKTAATEPFDGPNAVAVSPANVVYLVTNTSLYFYDPAGPSRVGAVWPGGQDIVVYATGVAADSQRAGVLYVSDFGRSAVVQLTLLAQSVVFEVLAGGTSVPVCTSITCPANAPSKRNAFDGVGALAVFGELGHLVHDAAGNRLLIADVAAHLIRSLDLASNAVTTVSGNVTRSTNAEGDGNPNAGNNDGLGAAATYRQPYGLAIVGPGAALVSDSFNNAVRLLSLGPLGAVFTVAGTPGEGEDGYMDGDGASALFADPAGMAFAPDGSVVVADAVNGAIRRVACNFFPSASASPAPPAPAPPAPAPAAPASDNILGPVVAGGLRSGALAIIIASVVAALGGAFALWWYFGGGSGAGRGALYTSASSPAPGLPGSPKAYSYSLAAGGGGVELGGKAAANPYAAATAAAAARAAAPALPGGVQEWSALAPRA